MGELLWEQSLVKRGGTTENSWVYLRDPKWLFLEEEQEECWYFFWEIKQCVSFSCIFLLLWTSVPRASPPTDSSIKTELWQAWISRPPCTQHFSLLSQSNPLAFPWFLNPTDVKPVWEGNVEFRQVKQVEKGWAQPCAWSSTGASYLKRTESSSFSLLTSQEQGAIIGIIYTLLYTGVIQEW